MEKGNLISGIWFTGTKNLSRSLGDTEVLVPGSSCELDELDKKMRVTVNKFEASIGLR